MLEDAQASIMYSLANHDATDQAKWLFGRARFPVKQKPHNVSHQKQEEKHHNKASQRSQIARD